jgi:DNA-binding CsgD family transcriptional regulator
MVVDVMPHLDELMRVLTSSELFRHESSDDPGDLLWLRDRYAEIVPTVLPDAIRSISTGEPLSARACDCIRASALAARGRNIPLSGALRGGVPALRAFAAFVQAVDSTFTLRESTVIMGRAGLIAQELGACWVESWRATGVDPLMDGSTVELVAAPQHTPDDDDPALEMVALAASGQSTEQIATATAYSPQAVKWHLGRLMKSWNVANRSALVSMAFVRGAIVARRRRPGAEG